MNITILGTGVVGQTIANRLMEMNHNITMGTRNPHETIQRKDINPMTGHSFVDWHKENAKVKLSTFENAADKAMLIINATSGLVSMEVLETIGREKLNNKVLLDVSNPLDFSQGMPPTLFVCNTESLAEKIQAAFPDTKVVKSLNTMNARIMMHPISIPGEHNVFVSGNDDKAKKLVTELLYEVGWKHDNIIDLGDISSARGTEMLLPLWLRLWNKMGNANFNFHIQKTP